MNPSSNESSGLNLPPPVGNTLPTIPNGAEANPGSLEQGPSVAAESGGKAVNAAAVATPAIPLPIVPTSTIPAVPVKPGASKGVVPSATNDTDLIEKEWVEKAKTIIEKNRDDPYKQSEELTVVKADYIQKRYGKTIKLSK